MKKTPRTELFETFAIQGLTLRDYFAAKAMQGLMAGAEDYSETRIAKLAYELADAMIKTREQNAT
jgi:hypothetical protein